MKKWLLAFALISFMGILCAQHAPFNGLIVNTEGKPIAKVRVSVEGNKKKFTRTDKDGRFGLTNLKAGSVLSIKSKNCNCKITVNDLKGIKIIIAGDRAESQNAPELADFGYGYVKRREYNSRSTGITGEELQATGAKDLLEAISAKVPGMNFTGGGYMQSSTVQIGGTKSFSGSTMPLFIIDGMKTSSIDHLRITDVEYVEISKDGSMYGSEGANGVIIIKTKK